eukprot:30919-Chlamydomonas_euryale.AAC.2
MAFSTVVPCVRAKACMCICVCVKRGDGRTGVDVVDGVAMVPCARAEGGEIERRRGGTTRVGVQSGGGRLRVCDRQEAGWKEGA